MSTLLEQASLVMIPSGYKEDVVYSQIPTSGAGDLTFTRASNGTRVNSAGFIEVCPWNLLQYSQEIGNGIAWQSLNAIVITPNSTTAPDGTMTADTLLDVGGASIVRQFDYSVVAGQTYTFSVYLKKATGSPLTRIRIEQDQSPYNNTYIDVTPTNEWVRYSVTRTIEAGITSVNYGIFPDINNGDSVYAWGAQVNIGSTAKPYFPTTDRLNVPRLTYKNGGGGCPSLLLEKQSTNVVTYSEQFDNAVWTKTQMSCSANTTTSPDGTQNADSIANLATNNTPEFYQLISGLTSGATYTISAYFKANTHTKCYLRCYNGGTTSTPTVAFNLSTSAIIATYGNASNATIESVGNGWYKCAFSFVSTGTDFYPQIGNLADSYSYNSGYNYFYNFSTTGSVYIWGAQLEESSYATSYIPTTSSSATRVADACSKTGISSLIGQTEGVAFVDFDFNGNYSNGGIIPISLDGGAGSELYIWVQTSGLLLCEVANSGSVQASITGAIGSLGRKKIAFAYKQNDFVVYLNGTQFGTDTSGTVPTMSRLYVGKYYANNTYDLNAGVNQAILFPTRLTNAELASLTTI